MVAEVCCSVNLDIRILDGFSDRLLKGTRLVSVLIEDIIVADSIEEVDSGAVGVRRHAVGVGCFDAMAISLLCHCAVEVNNFDCEPDGLQ